MEEFKQVAGCFGVFGDFHLLGICLESQSGTKGWFIDMPPEQSPSGPYWLSENQIRRISHTRLPGWIGDQGSFGIGEVAKGVDPKLERAIRTAIGRWESGQTSS